MKRWREIKKLAEDFLKCGVAGWCLEVMFTAAESLARGDWKLMGRTSLIMFPIYGMGALLGPIGKLTDRWIGDANIRASDRAVRHGMLYMVLIFLAEYTTGA